MPNRETESGPFLIGSAPPEVALWSRLSVAAGFASKPAYSWLGDRPLASFDVLLTDVSWAPSPESTVRDLESFMRRPEDGAAQKGGGYMLDLFCRGVCYWSLPFWRLPLSYQPIAWNAPRRGLFANQPILIRAGERIELRVSGRPFQPVRNFEVDIALRGK